MKELPTTHIELRSVGDCSFLAATTVSDYTIPSQYYIAKYCYGGRNFVKLSLLKIGKS